MTLFIKLQDGAPVGYPIEEANFRQLFSNISFPTYFTAEAVEPLGYGIYDFSNAPEPGRYEKVVEATPVRNEYGIWKQTWAAVAMTLEERAVADNDQWKIIRNERNRRLAACDWMYLTDATVPPPAWAAYRQALRDLPQDNPDPFNIVWPTSP